MSEYDENAVPEEETAPEIPEDDAAEASEETTAEDNKTKTEEKEQAPENEPEKKTRRIPLFSDNVPHRPSELSQKARDDRAGPLCRQQAVAARPDIPQILYQ